MKKKTAKDDADIDLQKLARKIFDDVFARYDLQKEQGENPSAEALQKLAQLDKQIEKNRREYTRRDFSKTYNSFEEKLEQVLEGVALQDEEELLRQGDEAFAPALLQRIIKIRNEFYDYTSHLYLPAESEQMKELLDSIIERAKALLAEKQKSAEAKFPGLARSVRHEFEMSDYYKKAVAEIALMAEKREEIAKNLKYAHPNKRKEVIAGLAEMDRLINEAEQFLAERYEAYQKQQRWLDGLRRMFKEASQSELHAMREHIKKNPGESPIIEKLMAEEFPETE